MANELGTALERALGGALKGAFLGYAGSIFAPASAAAVGGTLAVTGACAIAGSCFAFAALPIIEFTLNLAKEASEDPNASPSVVGVLGALTAAEIGVALYLGYELTAVALGVAASPILTCFLTGALVVTVGVVVLSAVFSLLEKALDANMEEHSQDFLHA